MTPTNTQTPTPTIQCFFGLSTSQLPKSKTPSHARNKEGGQQNDPPCFRKHRGILPFCCLVHRRFNEVEAVLGN
ncbi:MAG: hypothetical protein EB085_08890 [Betaproteobacteria bacterium]|nr:hypothetical protein [Betaproteobacteria bacterium]